MNTQDIFKLLICIGCDIENSIIPSEHIIDSLKPFHRINMIHREYYAYASNLTDSEFIALIKGLTYVERKLSWIGGSVATCKHLFSALMIRPFDWEKKSEITNWILCNSSNRFWSPRVLHSQRSVNALCSPSNRNDTKITTYAVSARIETEAQEKKRAYSHQCRKEPARLELIKKLNNMPVTKQLEMISCDDVYLPNFYPTRCAKLADIRAIESLSPEIRYALILKMKGKFKGPWGKFKKRLAAVYGVAESNNLWGG